MSARPTDAPAGVRKSQLSPARQRLVALLGRVHFGRIEGLAVLGGEPVFDPAPRVVRTLKMNGANRPRATSAAPDFQLKQEVVELLEHLARLGDGVVQRIEVAHGLPLLAEVCEPVPG